MYLLLLTALLGLGGWITITGGLRGSAWRIGAGIAVAAAGVAFFALLDFWGELLWFEAVGYPERFWTLVSAQAAAIAVGALLGLAGVWVLTWRLMAQHQSLWIWAGAIAAAGGGLWGFNQWQEMLLFLNRVSSGLQEPILHRDTGFYLFVLPLLDAVFWLLVWIVLVVLGAALASILDWRMGSDIRVRRMSGGGRPDFLPLSIASAALAVVLAFRQIINVFYLLYSDWGVVAGPGWTDVHVRLPGYLILAVIILILGGAPLLPSVRRFLYRWLQARTALDAPELFGLGAIWAAIAILWFAGLRIAPALMQWLVVEPNEITYEAPYIAHNIRFTRHGFRLHQIEERQFPASGRLTPAILERNQNLLDNVRLWDWRALDAVYQQFQEIRLYYEFQDVDVDRYALGGRYRQVMVSARELDQNNLPAQSQTFVNRRFVFTHGYGLTLTTVSDFTPQGLPNLLIRDIPPKVSFPVLEVKKPQIYYGELTNDYVVVNTEEKEFDHPSGDQNVYIHYPGKGGVPIDSLWRKFLFGWKFDGTRLLLSGYPGPESRILFHREIRERAATLAPFLTLDDDPYVVLAGGRLYWIIDAYTTSGYYPYSEPFSSLENIGFEQGGRNQQFAVRTLSYLDGVNYVRNSVKVVVDAFDGKVDFYVFEPDDPLIRAWRGVFPGLFKDREAMPPELRKHIRYPSGLLLAQGLVYAKYHMGDPAVFYNQEDLWVRATERYYDHVEPVSPYYVMWQLPGSDRAEFVLMLPFTPKNRQVLIGWIAGLCDGDNYGRFLAYKFPKERRVLGPQQVETKIDQDPFLSGQLTLWDQRGSKVIRGNVLAIPIDDALLYVEPIYLQAETAAYPELRLVAVMQGDKLSYAENFGQALQGLFEGGMEKMRQAPGLEGSMQELALRANAAFENYLKLLGEQKFKEAAGELQMLKELLEQMAAEAGK